LVGEVGEVGEGGAQRWCVSRPGLDAGSRSLATFGLIIA
jgi:hypothetical protein